MSNQIFEPVEIGGIKLKNKIIRSATHEGLADKQGHPQETLKTKYVQIAKGEGGAIITGYAGITQAGKGAYNMLMIDKDEHIQSYKELVDAVHKYNTPIIMQIAHCGRQTTSRLTGLPTVAPSAIKDKVFANEIPKELSDNEIAELIDDFVKAIIRAKQAGFDGVELHIAHGYLLAQFLSPYMNIRQDQWGGNTENRFRIIAEILNKARKQVGAYPIWAKINAYDNRKNGMRVEEAVKISKLLEQAGCNAIEVSCGVMEDGLLFVRNATSPIDAAYKYMRPFCDFPNIVKILLRPIVSMVLAPKKPLYNYNVPAAEIIKQNVTIPVIAVGGIRSLDDIEEIINNKKADLVSLSRPFILEPSIVAKFKTNKQKTARCKNCCFCLLALLKGEVTKCHFGKV